MLDFEIMSKIFFRFIGTLTLAVDQLPVASQFTVWSVKENLHQYFKILQYWEVETLPWVILISLLTVVFQMQDNILLLPV